MSNNKDVIWFEKAIYKNKKNGQYTIPISRKMIEDFFKGKKVPKKIKIKFFK